jgi:restriction endonuclease NotI
MELEFRTMHTSNDAGLPFPTKNRRPDYRSSGPKRLLPQLEIKVPTLSTWGKKMAVVVDDDFFGQLGSMREANDLSNAELAWFIVQYLEEGAKISLHRKRVFITRLKDAIEGLVAAVPVPRPQFEEAIRSKLLRLS